MHLAALAAIPSAVLIIAGCGGAATTSAPAGQAGSSTGSSSSSSSSSAPSKPPKPPPPAHPELLGSAVSSAPTGFVPAVRWKGQTAAWIARSSGGATLLSFNQPLVGLHLHTGTIDGGAAGWRFGPRVTGSERSSLVAAFNGGFKFDTGAGGFSSYDRVAVPLSAGLGSIVTYADGSTDIGAWHRGLPAAGKPVVSVRQNLSLLIDNGNPAATLDCRSCWGATLGGVSDPARSALGVTADGHLIWAGGEHLTVAQLADALTSARVVRAVELDINPQWVAGYLYRHRGSALLTPVGVVTGQAGVPGSFLNAYSRDFFTIVGR
jgi:hypothetical protein